MSLRTWYIYQLERLVLRGAAARLAIVLSLLGVVALLGGTLAYIFPGDHFGSYRDALWWALLRLSDPGYLSDDVGLWGLRALSLALSVVGMSILVGGIVAIVTEWLNASIDTLEQARTPVSFEGHTVLIGWTDRTPRLLQALITRNRKKVVVFVPEVTPELLSALREALVSNQDRHRVVLRSGNVHRPTELIRSACGQSRTVILAASHSLLEGDLRAGPRLLKTLIALKKCIEDSNAEAPRVVIELPDQQLSSMVKSLLPGATTILSDQMVAKMVSLALADSRSLAAAAKIFDPESEQYLKTEALLPFQGQKLSQTAKSLESRRVVGLIRELDAADGTQFLVPEETTIESADLALVVCAKDDEKTEGPERGGVSSEKIKLEVTHQESTGATLILGFNAAVADLLVELSRGQKSKASVTLLAPTPAQKIHEQLASVPAYKVASLQLECIEARPTSASALNLLELGKFKRVFIAANRSAPSAEDSDVDVLATALALFERKAELAPDATIVSEILNDENEDVVSQVPHINTPNLVADLLLTASSDSSATLALQRQGTKKLYRLGIANLSFSDVSDASHANTAPSIHAIASRLRKEDMALITIFEGSKGKASESRSLRALVLKAQID